MSYGFRLFYFNLTERFRRTNLSLSGKVGTETVDGLLGGLLTSLCAQPDLLRAAMPSLKKTADGDDVTPPTPSERGDKAIKWLAWKQEGPLHLSAHVRFGRVDGHDLAMGPAGDVDIKGMAPSHKFRVDILLPRDGEAGVLVAEDIDRICPARPAAQWIGKQSQLSAETAEDSNWYRMTLQAFTDEQRLRELIKNSKRAEIHLKRFAKSGSGKNRQSPLTIKSPLEQSKDLKELLTAATAWASGDKEAVAQSVTVLSEIVGDDVAALEPDQASVHIEDAPGSVRQSGLTGSTRSSSTP